MQMWRRCRRICMNARWRVVYENGSVPAFADMPHSPPACPPVLLSHVPPRRNFPARAAQGIVDAMKAEITQFHALSKGNIESIGLLFSEMAQQPLPPQVICKILGMDEEAVKAAFEKGEPV